MDDALALKMIEGSIKLAFEQAAASFQANPNSDDNWLRLVDCMWARQALTSKSTMAESLPRLKEAGIGTWVTLLRQIHRGE